MLVKQLVHRFSNAGVDPNNIAVIAPYAAQVRFLRDMLGSRSVEIDTVDGFQGREKDLVILTMVGVIVIGRLVFFQIYAVQMWQ